jgi:mRNA-degrading endonuclease toxin of MazEF toxin-antitoxin module
MLILTREEHIERQFDVIAVPATGTARGWDTELELGPRDGMPVVCVLAIHNTLLAQKSFLTEYITTLDSARMSEVCRMLAYATNC